MHLFSKLLKAATSSSLVGLLSKEIPYLQTANSDVAKVLELIQKDSKK